MVSITELVAVISLAIFLRLAFLFIALYIVKRRKNFTGSSGVVSTRQGSG
jgi:hypothetical protein